MDTIFKLINLSEFIIGYPIIAIYWILRDKVEIDNLFSLCWELMWRIFVIVGAVIVVCMIINIFPKIIRKMMEVFLLILSLTLIGIGIYGVLLNFNIFKLAKGNNFSIDVSLNFFESILFFFVAEIAAKMNKMIIKD